MKLLNLEAILELLPQIVWITNSSGQLLFVNRAWSSYTGSHSGESDWASFYHPDDLPAIAETWKTALALGNSYEFEFRIRSKEGIYRWFLSRGSRQQVDGVENWVGTLTDIDDQKRALTLARESELVRKESELRFKAIVEQSPFPTQLLRMDGSTIQVNSAWMNLWGVDQALVDNFLLKNYNILRDPLMESLGLSASVREVFTGKSVQMNAVYYNPADLGQPGRPRWVDAFFSPIRSASGDLTEIVLMFNDVTAQKESEKGRMELIASERAAVEASKLKSEFLASMSHEIRTPINGVLGMTGLLSETELNQEQRSYADAVKRSGELLLTVINDILDFSKIEAGKLEFENIDFDLRQSLLDCQSTLAFAANKKHLALDISMSANLPLRVTGDPGRLKQILVNLVGNAIKFTEQGTVHLSAKSVRQGDASGFRPHRLRFEVKDTGLGISDKNQEKLFSAFSQADASTHRRHGGTGLGLSISKKLVESMHGEIGVKSEVNVGSTFWFEIELGVATNEGLVTLPTKETVFSSKKRKFRVLIAEDNHINQLITSKMLDKMNIHTDVVANGIEAVNALREVPYDLVLMDCQMPEMDGYEATQVIRADLKKSAETLPILAMTANAMQGDSERCLAAGMNDYISKPVDRETLFAVLSKWLKTS